MYLLYIKNFHFFIINHGWQSIEILYGDIPSLLADILLISPGLPSTTLQQVRQGETQLVNLDSALQSLASDKAGVTHWILQSLLADFFKHPLLKELCFCSKGWLFWGTPPEPSVLSLQVSEQWQGLCWVALWPSPIFSAGNFLSLLTLSPSASSL